MQISRHWRLNPQRYRLEGGLYLGKEGSFVSLQNRPLTAEQVDKEVQAQKEIREQRESKGKKNIIEFGNSEDSETKVLPTRKAV